MVSVLAGKNKTLQQCTPPHKYYKKINYDDYLPIEYKKNRHIKKPLEGRVEKNEELFYVYGDGTISKEYYSEKAKMRFDRLEDKSGVDWKAGYDPNGSIKKNGWHGEFDHSGIWVMVDDDEEYVYTLLVMYIWGHYDFKENLFGLDFSKWQ